MRLVVSARRCRTLIAASVLDLVGGMTLAAPGATGFVAPAVNGIVRKFFVVPVAEPAIGTTKTMFIVQTDAVLRADKGSRNVS